MRPAPRPPPPSGGLPETTDLCRRAILERCESISIDSDREREHLLPGPLTSDPLQEQEQGDLLQEQEKEQGDLCSQDDSGIGCTTSLEVLPGLGSLSCPTAPARGPAS